MVATFVERKPMLALVDLDSAHGGHSLNEVHTLLVGSYVRAHVRALPHSKGSARTPRAIFGMWGD